MGGGEVELLCWAEEGDGVWLKGMGVSAGAGAGVSSSAGESERHR